MNVFKEQHLPPLRCKMENSRGGGQGSLRKSAEYFASRMLFFFFLFELLPARVLTLLMKAIREPHGSCSTRNRNTVPLFSR